MRVSVKLETPNYLFLHQFKTEEPTFPLLDLVEQDYFTASLKDRRTLEQIQKLVSPPAAEDDS